MTAKQSYRKYKLQQAKFKRNKAIAQKKRHMTTAGKIKLRYQNSIWRLKRALGLNYSNKGT